MNKIPVIIDVDTGTDDAVAIACATYLKTLDVRLITCGSGNTSVENVKTNTLNILQFIHKSNVKVAVGAGNKFKPNKFYLNVHSATGMGDFEFPELKIKEIDKSAEDAIIEEVKNSPVPITIIGLGPLSNIAQAIDKDRGILNNINEIVISGGLIEKLDNGQFPYTSFNIAYDDEAVKLILESGVKITVVPSNMGHDAYLTYEEVYKTKTMNETGACFEKIFRSYHDRHVKNGIATHDLCAVCYVSNGEMFKSSPAYSCVKNEGANKEGILKFNFLTSSPNTIVVTEINILKFKRLYFKTLKRMP